MEADAALLKNLGRILVYGVAFALATLGYYIAHGVARGLRGIPFVGGALASVSNAIERYIAEPIDALRKADEAAVTAGLSGLVDKLAVWLGLAALVALGVKAALTYMWNTALEVRVAKWIAHAIAQIDLPHVHIPTLIPTIVTRVKAALKPELDVLRRDAAAAKAASEAAAKAASEAAAKATATVVTNVTETVTNPTTYVTETVEQVVPGLVEALTAVGGELADIPGIDLPHLRDILDGQDLTKLAGLLAAIPLARAIVSTIARESGLENAECRGKVKQVCATDTHAWAKLLAGAALAGVAFNLRDLVDVAKVVIDESVGVVKEFA